VEAVEPDRSLNISDINFDSFIESQQATPRANSTATMDELSDMMSELEH